MNGFHEWMEDEEKLVIPLQIRKALDGRSQRWLAQEISLTDDAMSRRMNGILQFAETELSAIEKVLNFKLKR